VPSSLSLSVDVILSLRVNASVLVVDGKQTELPAAKLRPPHGQRLLLQPTEQRRFRSWILPRKRAVTDCAEQKICFHSCV
jgi:hypothetical protein